MRILPFVKRSSASDLLLLFLVTAITSVLLTRFYLYLFHYPQLGTGSTHIAHVLFGGLYLLTAILILLIFQGRRARQLGAAVGGFGFGLFIDEIGKFITSNNDYFFQPAPMLIYLTFVVLFFIYHSLDKYIPRTPKELYYELLEYLENIAEEKLTIHTQKHITAVSKKLAKTHAPLYQQFAQSMTETLSLLPTEPPTRNKYVQKIHSSWKWLENFTTERKPVFYFLLFIFFLYVINVLTSTYFFMTIIWHHQFNQVKFGVDNRFELGMIAMQFVTQFASALFMLRGFFALITRHRRHALTFFQTGLGLNILLVQIVNFYFKQFSASVEMLFILVMFLIIHGMIDEDQNA